MQNVLEIISWYKKNLRELPWRQTNDPYKIWLSEVVLQQTQVVQGSSYYARFIEEFPDIRALAAAGEQEVLKLWQGLGYYSRARNLHKTAQIIDDQYHGKFPDDYKSLLSLPGIGDYTASAIMSFAFGKPYPALDGNVYRVIARLYDIELAINEPASRKVFIKILNEMIENANPAEFNNAMMELGALVCRPEKPDCLNCPVSGHCLALKKGTVSKRPVKNRMVKRKKRYFNYFHLSFGDVHYLEKRGAGDIWQHLWQMPLIESAGELNEADSLICMENELLYSPVYEKGGRKTVKHILTHQDIYAVFTEIKLKRKPSFRKDGFLQVNKDEVLNYPVPVLIEKFLLSL